MSPYHFRPFTPADLPMARRWLQTPAVVRWWGNPDEQLALLKNDLDEPRMRQWVVEYRRRAFAYLQAYEAHAWPQKHLQHLPIGARVFDTFIGEPAMTGCGHGSAYLRLFATMLADAGAPVIATDPDVRNLRARRAYARAGFAEQAIGEAEQGRVVLMVHQPARAGGAPSPPRKVGSG